MYACVCLLFSVFFGVCMDHKSVLHSRHLNTAIVELWVMHTGQSNYLVQIVAPQSSLNLPASICKQENKYCS